MNKLTDFTCLLCSFHAFLGTHLAIRLTGSLTEFLGGVN